MDKIAVKGPAVNILSKDVLLKNKKDGAEVELLLDLFLSDFNLDLELILPE
ncbi:MAG: hypothetical protein U9Q83_00915 [Bacteroidota bacterium]|nr:hypothetical protein [Bacteroidota bacterium]